MNKALLIEKISEKTTLNKRQVESVIDAMTSVIMATLKANEEVSLTGFGTFIAKKRSARLGVNPRNPKEKIQMPEVTVAKFKTGKVLKDYLKS